MITVNSILLSINPIIDKAKEIIEETRTPDGYNMG